MASQIAAGLTESHELCLVDRRQMAAKNTIFADLSSRPVTNGWSGWFKTKSWRGHVQPNPALRRGPRQVP
jgi:hypothetical protein